MATPQSQLYSISDTLNRLSDLLKGKEGTTSIIYIIEEMDLKMDEMKNSQEKIENLLNLIVKLLSKE